MRQDERYKFGFEFVYAPTVNFTLATCIPVTNAFTCLFRTEFEKELREEIRKLIPNPKNRFGTAG